MIYENGLSRKYHCLLDLSIKVKNFSENWIDHIWGFIACPPPQEREREKVGFEVHTVSDGYEKFNLLRYNAV